MKRDFYAELASRMFKRPYEDCLDYYVCGLPNVEGKLLRSAAKQTILKVYYGALEEGITIDDLNRFYEYHKSLNE